jgi:hypothetical protein
MGSMTKEALHKLINDGELEITDVIDAVIEINGIVGVGKIDLADFLHDYTISVGRSKKHWSEHLND